MRVYRLLAIVMLLLNRKKASAAELAEYFEVSPRTVYRDIEAICQAGIPVVSFQGVDGGFSILDNFKLDKNLFTPDEIVSILAALEGLNSTLNDRKIKDITEKIKVLAPEQTESGSRNNEELVIDLNPWNSNQHIKERLAVIKNAISEKRVIEFYYINLKHEKLTRRVEPISLVLKGTTWYLYGYCLLRNDYRIFRLSRMKNLSITADIFNPRAKGYKEFEKESDWFKTTNLVNFVLRFKPAAYLQVQDYFGEDKIEIQQDDSLMVSGSFPEDEWIVGFLLGFGDSVEVLEPEHLRQRVKEQAKLVVEKYDSHWS